MKTNSAQTDRLFLDRPLPEMPRATALHITGFDKTDYVDSILRVFLAVSLLGSLALCGRELSGPPSKTVVQQQIAAPAALVCTLATPAKPAAL